MQPLVSVCIPAYNCGKYIKETIYSLLKQTYYNLEVIVVDDGSGDNTKAVIEEIIDERIKYFWQKNKGAAAARNAAFKYSTGKYVKFLDADDLLNENFISAQVEKLCGLDNSISSASWGRFYNDSPDTFQISQEEVWKDMPAAEWLVESLIYSGANMMQPGLFLIPRPILVKSGVWNESLTLIDDFEFMCRVITNADNILFCEKAVLMYRSGVVGSLSSQKERGHMESAYRSVELGLEQLLKISQSRRTQQAAANTWQRLAYLFYPLQKDLLTKAEDKVKMLGGSNIPFVASKVLTLVAKYFGWKVAVILKNRLGKADV